MSFHMTYDEKHYFCFFYVFFLFQFRCTNCGESRDYWQYVVVNEVLDIPGSRGEANLVEKCKLCNRMNTVSIVKDSLGSYSSTEHNEEWQSMIQLDCRGLEPIDFDFRMGWSAVGAETSTVFDDIDLSEKVGFICSFSVSLKCIDHYSF
uniref:CXXC motif containing zinc binding protein n=1 Tax=Angiostrongylus cantonensis TaxID=6313 RepID=A0A0K0D4U4_ANGCA